MTPETLRRAAAQIRNDRGGVVSRATQDGRRWLPVADWLDAEADEQERLGSPGSPNITPAGSVAYSVANAYLGDTDPSG